MKKKNNEDKTNFVRLFLGKVEEDSTDKSAAEEYLRSEGVDVERLKSEGLARIRRKELKLRAKKTELEMIDMEAASNEARAWVENLLNKVDFSLTDLIRQEQLTVAFSHLQELKDDEIREMLIRHFTLKFMQKKPYRE